MNFNKLIYKNIISIFFLSPVFINLLSYFLKITLCCYNIGTYMTKADIVDEIAKATGLTKIETKAVVDGVFSSIVSAVSTGKRIELRGFGVFKHKGRKPRMARNPKTGELVPLEKRFVPVFKPSPEFLQKVNDTLKVQLDSNNE